MFPKENGNPAKQPEAKLFKNGHDYEISTYHKPKRILNAKGFKLLGVKFHSIQCKRLQHLTLGTLTLTNRGQSAKIYNGS